MTGWRVSDSACAEPTIEISSAFAVNVRRVRPDSVIEIKLGDSRSVCRDDFSFSRLYLWKCHVQQWGMPRPVRSGICKCGKPSAASKFYCLACHAEYMRLHRPKHSALTPEQRARANARSYANTYLKRGKIQRKPCEVCGAKAQMHHHDYSKPLDVRWLCRKHHLDCHGTSRVTGIPGSSAPRAYVGQ